MKRVTKSVLAYITLGFVVLTWGMAEFLSWYQLQEISSALVMMASLVGMTQWFVPAGRSLRDGRSGADFLALSIFLMLFSVAFQRIWINVLRWMGRPDWLVYSPISSTTALMIAYAVSLVILARETMDGDIPRRNIFLVLVSIFAAGFFYIVTISVFQTDKTDEYGQPNGAVRIPGIGAISCPDEKPIRIEAYCRAAPGKSLFRPKQPS